MPSTLSPDVVVAWTRLVRAEQALVDKVEEDVKRAGFPPLNWYDVLLQLDGAPDGRLPQAEIQERVLLAQYNLCRLADRLQAEGLIERMRCTEDARKGHLKITDKGRQLRAAMWPHYAAAIKAHLASRLTCEEARQLAKILEKLVDHKLDGTCGG